LRRNCFRGGRVILTVRFSDFSTLTRQKTALEPLTSGKEIYRLALRIWDSIGGKRPVRLLGVTVSNLHRPSNQLSLFSRPNRLAALWEAIDRVNDKYGDFTLTWGSLHQSPRRPQPGFP
jgi:DNA polymerase-4